MAVCAKHLPEYWLMTFTLMEMASREQFIPALLAVESLVAMALARSNDLSLNIEIQLSLLGTKASNLLPK
jgi:hypothetical protein